MNIHIKHHLLKIKLRGVLEKFSIYVNVRDCFEDTYFNFIKDMQKEKI